MLCMLGPPPRPSLLCGPSPPPATSLTRLCRRHRLSCHLFRSPLCPSHNLPAPMSSPSRAPPRPLRTTTLLHLRSRPAPRRLPRLSMSRPPPRPLLQSRPPPALPSYLHPRLPLLTSSLSRAPPRLLRTITLLRPRSRPLPPSRRLTSLPPPLPLCPLL